MVRRRNEGKNIDNSEERTGISWFGQGRYGLQWLANIKKSGSYLFFLNTTTHPILFHPRAVPCDGRSWRVPPRTAHERGPYTTTFRLFLCFVKQKMTPKMTACMLNRWTPLWKGAESTRKNSWKKLTDFTRTLCWTEMRIIWLLGVAMMCRSLRCYKKCPSRQLKRIFVCKPSSRRRRSRKNLPL